MTSKSLNRSLRCLPVKKHLLNSPSLMLQDTSCSLISCLQLCSRSHLLPQRGEELAAAKRSPQEPSHHPTGLWLSTGPQHTAHQTSEEGQSALGSSHPLKTLWATPVNWSKTWIVHISVQKIPSLMSGALGPSSWLIFKPLHPLEHSSITENKLTSANQFVNCKHAQNIHPSFKYRRSKGLAASYLRNLKSLSQTLFERIPSTPVKAKNHIYSVYLHSLKS